MNLNPTLHSAYRPFLMSQIEGIARSVAWGAGFAALGLTAGCVVDGILGRRLAGVSKDPTVKVFSQLVIGLAVLSEAIAVIMPADVVAPLSDGMMFYWFFEAQPVLKANVGRMLHSWSSNLFPGAAPVQPPMATTSPAQAPAPSQSTTQVVVSDGAKIAVPPPVDSINSLLAGFHDPLNPGRTLASAF